MLNNRSKEVSRKDARRMKKKKKEPAEREKKKYLSA